jgi:hypothetical protein
MLSPGSSLRFTFAVAFAGRTVSKAPPSITVGAMVVRSSASLLGLALKVLRTSGANSQRFNTNDEVNIQKSFLSNADQGGRFPKARELCEDAASLVDDCVQSFSVASKPFGYFPVSIATADLFIVS